MLDILTIVHNFADRQTASRIRRTCRRLAILQLQYNIRESPDGRQYRVGDLLHRLDGPALLSEGVVEWFRGGVAHREYHPQLLDDGILYRVDGRVHREYGPAHVFGICSMWYMRGLIHRRIGPAYKMSNLFVWVALGKIHRLDGPAYSASYLIRGAKHRICEPLDSGWFVNDKLIREY